MIGTRTLPLRLLTPARRAGRLSLGHLAEDAERIGRRRLRLDSELRHTGAGKRRQSGLAFEERLSQSDLLELAGEPRNLDINVGALVERALLVGRRSAKVANWRRIAAGSMCGTLAGATRASFAPGSRPSSALSWCLRLSCSRSRSS
jgi:hypothetical protein